MKLLDMEVTPKLLEEWGACWDPGQIEKFSEDNPGVVTLGEILERLDRPLEAVWLLSASAVHAGYFNQLHTAAERVHYTLCPFTRPCTLPWTISVQDIANAVCSFATRASSDLRRRDWERRSLRSWSEWHQQDVTIYKALRKTLIQEIEKSEQTKR